MVSRLLATAALVCVSAVVASESAAPAPAKARKVVAPAATRTVSPIHPPELLRQLVGGEAVVEGLVSETGAVVDTRVESASRPEFGEAAVTALRQWEFTPGTIEGKPAAVRVRIPFDFPLSVGQKLRLLTKREVFHEVSDPIIPAQELAEWPVPRQLLLPRYPRELEGSGKYGKAVVSVVIDKDGQVVNPRIVKATYPEFELPALMTAASLKFPPQVMANKERVHVSLDIQFDFKETRKPREDKPAEKSPAKPDKKG